MQVNRGKPLTYTALQGTIRQHSHARNSFTRALSGTTSCAMASALCAAASPVKEAKWNLESGLTLGCDGPNFTTRCQTVKQAQPPKGTHTDTAQSCSSSVAAMQHSHTSEHPERTIPWTHLHTTPTCDFHTSQTSSCATRLSHHGPTGPTGPPREGPWPKLQSHSKSGSQPLELPMSAEEAESSWRFTARTLFCRWYFALLCACRFSRLWRATSNARRLNCTVSQPEISFNCPVCVSLRPRMPQKCSTDVEQASSHRRHCV